MQGPPAGSHPPPPGFAGPKYGQHHSVDRSWHEEYEWPPPPYQDENEPYWVREPAASVNSQQRERFSMAMDNGYPGHAHRNAAHPVMQAPPLPLSSRLRSDAPPFVHRPRPPEYEDWESQYHDHGSGNGMSASMDYSMPSVEVPNLDSGGSPDMAWTHWPPADCHSPPAPPPPKPFPLESQPYQLINDRKPPPGFGPVVRNPPNSDPPAAV